MKKNYSFTKRLKSFWNQIFLKTTCLGALAFLPQLGSSQTVTYTFTNAGATGRLGPTQLQLNAAYLSTNLNGSVTSVAGIQTLSIPSSGMWRVEAWGASGGLNNTTYSGYGARVVGEVSLTAGTVLRVVVGQAGSSYCTSNSDGGGGASYVVAGTTLLFAAGGGGGGAQTQVTGQNASITQVNTNSVQSQFGSSGAGYSVNGVHFNYSIYTTVAQAFTNGSNGQAGGQAGGWPGGTYGEGGFGGGGSSCSCSTGGGGGGGGYVGGGGGGGSYTSGYGGSSYLINTAVNTASSVLTSLGQGKVLLTRLCNINISSSLPGGGTALCAGSSVTLTTDAASGILWSTGATTNSIVVSPINTSTYGVTGTSTAACVASAAMILTVSATVPSLVVTASTNSICLGRTATLTANGALTYTWSNGVGNGVSFNPTTTTTYVVTGGNGCGTSTAAVSITVSPLAVNVVSQPTLVCAAQPATLTASSAVTAYTWQPGNLTGPSVIVGPSSLTVYTVSATDGTCSGTATLSLPVNPLPTVNIVSTTSVTCQGGIVSMTASGGISYTWSPGNLSGPTVTFSPTGPTLYSVVASNSFNCTQTANQVVVTNPSPTLSIIASDNLICSGSSATLTVNGASTYTWLNNNSNNNVQTVSPTSTTIYSVTGLTSGNNCPTTSTMQVAVFTPTLTVSGPTAICSGGTATLTASGADTYQWDNGAPVPIISVNPLSTTIYTVSAVTASGNINCASTGSISITVNPNPTITVVPTRTFMCVKESNTLTASGAGSYSWNTTETTAAIVVSSTLATTLNYSVTGTDATGCKSTKVYQLKFNGCTGINEFNSFENGVSLYPNPNNGNFDLESIKDMDLRIVNELGQVIKTIKLNQQNNHKVSVQNLESGIYFVQGGSFNAKILVEK